MVEFELPMVSDQVRREEARAKKWKTDREEWMQGLISQETLAARQGIDEPYMQAPREEFSIDEVPPERGKGSGDDPIDPKGTDVDQQGTSETVVI